MKKYLVFAASALALAGCSSDDFVGDNQGNVKESNAAINFSSGTNKITRAVKEGKDAATALNNNFVVYGYKTAGEKYTVYDHYNVNYIEGSEIQTVSNKAGWEYVGQTPNALNSVTGAEQTIKYWDYSASQYDFVAFSFGETVQGTATDKTNKVVASTVNQTPEYTLEGSVDDLAKCYISDRVTAKKTATTKITGYGNPVKFNFRSLKSQVRLAIYETVPGYSIKNIIYYSDATTSLSGVDCKPTLYAKDNNIPAGDGTMTITFPETNESKTDFNQAKVKWSGTSNTSTISWDKLTLTDAESKEQTTPINDKIYLGRDFTHKSESDYKNVLPGTEVKGLTLKVDYTLVSTDGSGEEINVTGATATIPDVYTQWKPNYAYTYLFKISDKTNGGTGGETDPKGLYPITFDAVVTETETGKQETITAVEENSITTYAKGAVGEEYKAGSNIYVSVGNNQALETNTSTDAGTVKNIALYVVDEANTTGYAITEANVALALSKTPAEGVYTLTEGSNKLTVKAAAGLTLTNEINAADAVDGNAISGNFAKFTPTTDGKYIIEYIDQVGTPNAKKYYKVIIVK